MRQEKEESYYVFMESLKMIYNVAIINIKIDFSLEE